MRPLCQGLLTKTLLRQVVPFPKTATTSSSADIIPLQLQHHLQHRQHRHHYHNLRLQQNRRHPQRPSAAAFHHRSPALAMKTARVAAWGSPPEYKAGPDLPPPTPEQVQLRVLAVAVPPLVRGRAVGKHPSARGAELPYDPSVDGVGLDEATGESYYVAPMAAPLLAERVNVDRRQVIRLPAGADPVAVATLVNPVGSSWMALRCRALAGQGCEGATVLVLGATSTSGRAAVAVARSLGAARVIGASRSEATLAAVEGLDDRVLLREPLTLPQGLGPIHIVLDFVGGPAAVAALAAAEPEPGRDLQYIHVGDLAGHDEIALPARLLNSKPIRITGSGMGAWSKMDMKKELPGLLEVVGRMKRPDDVLTAPLADVQSVWESEDAKTKRLVLVT